MNSNFIISCHAFKGSILTILSSDNLDWLDKGLPPNKEGKWIVHEDDGATSCRVSKRTSNATQERDIDSHHKGKGRRIVSSSPNSDDSNNWGSKGVVTLVGAMEELVALVRILEKMVALVAVMLVKQILACHGHKEMKITMLHKIQIMHMGTMKSFGKINSISQWWWLFQWAWLS